MFFIRFNDDILNDKFCCRHEQSCHIIIKKIYLFGLSWQPNGCNASRMVTWLQPSG